ncbi:unnamed protein product [Symbiodinium natans]|uniref:Uncharacterized protein n=1 Tax=Symbiodinium natans TaxID=878477 RepID=A0A812QGJ2_9DINO|nr:unnamed protein product [Symbiodinium natans]
MERLDAEQIKAILAAFPFLSVLEFIGDVAANGTEDFTRAAASLPQSVRLAITEATAASFRLRCHEPTLGSSTTVAAPPGPTLATEPTPMGTTMVGDRNVVAFPQQLGFCRSLPLEGMLFGLDMASLTPMDRIVLPLIASQAAASLDTITQEVQWLVAHGADRSLVAHFKAGYFKQDHDSFHAAPELRIGNWCLAFCATQFCDAFVGMYNNSKSAGLFVEAWIVHLRSSANGQLILQHFVYLGRSVSSVTRLFRQCICMAFFHWQIGSQANWHWLHRLADLHSRLHPDDSVTE